MRGSDLKRWVPGWVRERGRTVAYAASSPLRRWRVLPGAVVTGAELTDLARLFDDVEVTTERVEHRWADPTHSRSPITEPPRPVKTDITHVRSSGTSGWRFDLNHLVAPDGRVVYESNLDTSTLGSAFNRLTPAPRRVAGTVAYLSNTWPTNFFHWMVLTLPLVDRYRALGIEPDWWYVGEPATGWQLESLELVGIDPSTLLTGAVTADELHTIVCTRIGGGLDPRSIRFVRDLVGADERPSGGRRLFLRRGSATTRRFLNEDACGEAASVHGFVPMATTGLGLADEVALFGDAEAVIACHGSVLTNLLFAPRGVTVIELFPHDLHVPANHSFQELTAAADGIYAAVEGEPPGGPRRKPIDRDLRIDPAALDSVVSSVLGPSGG